ncbi:hypothetical protein SCHPADRAFT_889391 [Schizopora paradoxa]|uniref:Concanavalin A-like lectin/glucanase n=1 Tax=Schizopora paradoxa TaxID=27342 RepID=A0A0H2RXP4_9AGAM|nr:hypothetical protein SCHPADRAFT_889391 [Schizopora paradoxa]
MSSAKYSLIAFGIAATLGQGAIAQFLYAGCDVSNAVLSLPSGQTQLQLPSGLSPNSIALGVGVQNYTCTSAGNYTSAGAVAEFFDISCLLQASQTTFNEVQNLVFEFWNGTASADLSTLAELSTTFTETWLLDVHLGTHVFQPNPAGSGISPVFDYRAASRQHDADAFVLAAPKGNLPAPTGPQDVAWLELTQVQGDLGKIVFRVDTIGGQPPSSCTPGSAPISVKYSAKYWFFGGPASPIVQEFESIVADVWNQINSGYYADKGSTYTSTGSSKSGVKAVSSDDDDEVVSNTAPVLSFDPKSKSFPATIALIVINGILVVGILAAIVMYMRRTKREKNLRYVAAGAHNAPK